MKISDVKRALIQYEANVSGARGYWKESHMQQLENFYIKINGNVGAVTEDRKLKPEEYLEVAKIIHGKKTWSTRPSSIALGALANILGGRQAVNHFKEKLENQLTGINLGLLELYTAPEEGTASEETTAPEKNKEKSSLKDEAHGYLLAQLLDILSPIAPSHAPVNFLGDICEQAGKQTLTDKLGFIQKLVDAKIFEKSAYLLVLKSKNAQLITDLLILLSKNGLCNEINLDKLESLDIQDAGIASSLEEKKLVLLKKILLFFTADPSLMMQTTLTTLFKHDELWSELRELVEGLHSAEYLTSSLMTELFAHPEAIGRAKEISRIIAHFQKADWKLEHYWMAILKTNDGSNVESATSKLCQLALNPAQAVLVLNRLFAAPQYGENIVEGVETLARISPVDEEDFLVIDEEDLLAVLGVQKDAHALAEGIVAARKSPNYDGQVRNFISQKPAYALGLASVYRLLDLAELNTAEIRELVLSRSSDASLASLILQRMNDNNLFNRGCPESFKNLKRLYDNKLISLGFSKLQTLLQEANLFNQPNFEVLCTKAKHCKELAEACSVLAAFGKGKLTQNNLELLFENAADAKTTAAILCGQEPQPKQLKHADHRDVFFSSNSYPASGMAQEEVSDEKSDSSGYSDEESDESDEETSPKATKETSSSWSLGGFISSLVSDGTQSDSEEDDDEEQQKKSAIVCNP
ncbi:hypothetical protein Lnau_0010 [Legionella nautarum]|uniref:Uncharacterized protein n=1 Tax=Legionella nautarum TaxID=45070 RepID=A0A0W0X3T9_9GAMM|nr:hypothetical protein [Legionella nautarum]KTD39243.1 hypothetical protein Lnau_0010 [Legionella nautarum]